MSGIGTSGEGYAGQQDPSDGSSEFNAHSFVIQQLIGLMATATLVKVLSVTNDGEVSESGTVSVQPLVKLLDGQGNASEHGPLNNIPYFRIQGGANAVIMDPKVGDIGIAIFADRDISSVKATKDQANPGSRRRFDMADGLYIGGFLNGIPEQYVRFYEGGVQIVDKNANAFVMDTSGIAINGVLFDRSRNISNAGTVMATGEGTFDGHTVGAHTHGGVTTGAGTTATPTG